MNDLILTTSDQQKIYCTVFSPTKISNHKVVIINSATGVKQQFYFSFSKYLSSLGYTVVTYDYRGIGLSKPHNMRQSSGSMRDWGSKDFFSVSNYVINQFPSYEKYIIGHSVGALIIGMNPNSMFFEKFIFIGTQNAYYGHLGLRTKISAFLGFSIVQPISSLVFGYFPGQFLGLGESLPKEASKDWAHLILKKRSTDYLLDQLENEVSKVLNKDVFVVYAEDDDWLEERGVKSLLNDTYPNLKPTFRIIKKEESEVKQIGHVNFFRSYNKNLWSIIETELNVK